MAEFTIRAEIACKNANFVVPKQGGQFTDSQALQEGGGPGVVGIPTAGEDVVLTDITNVGWCMIENLDTVNFVTYGPKITAGAVFHPFGRLLPGHKAIFMLNAANIPSTHTFHMKADTADVKVRITIFGR